MSTSRSAVVVLVLLAAACGDKADPPTAPSASRRAVGMTIVVPGPTLGVGESIQLSAVAAYSDGSREPATNVVWATSQASVCALTPGGVLVAIGPGSATITASAGEVSTAPSLIVEFRAGSQRRVQGRLVDFASNAPIADDALGFMIVRVGGGTAVSGPDGWYRIDLGCVDDPFNNSNTTFLRATHPAYRDYERVAGRGVHRVRRFDVELLRPWP